MKLVDLDKLVSPDIKVRIGGHDYVVPGDLPADLYLEINQRAQEAGDLSEFEGIKDLHERVLNLFRYRQPDLTEIPGVSLKQLLLAIGEIYGDGGEEETVEPARPPRQKRSGGATRTGSKSRPKTSSRR